MQDFSIRHHYANQPTLAKGMTVIDELYCLGNLCRDDGRHTCSA